LIIASLLGIIMTCVVAVVYPTIFGNPLWLVLVMCGFGLPLTREVALYLVRKAGYPH
jgi:hypothetical protein